MALKLVITTRTEKQFDTLVTLGTHLKARLNWLVRREYGTVILQSAKVKYYFGFPDSVRWFWNLKLFSFYIIFRGFEFTRANCVSCLIIILRRTSHHNFKKDNQWEIFDEHAVKWVSTQFWTFINSHNDNNNHWIGIGSKKSTLNSERDWMPMCRLCGEREETVSHIATECKKLAQKQYKNWRHDQVAKVVLGNPAKITIRSVTKLGTIIPHLLHLSVSSCLFVCLFFRMAEFSFKCSFQFPPLYRAWNFCWLSFQEIDKCSCQNGVGKQRNKQWIFPQNDTFLWGLVRVSKYWVSMERAIYPCWLCFLPIY